MTCQLISYCFFYQIRVLSEIEQRCGAAGTEQRELGNEMKVTVRTGVKAPGEETEVVIYCDAENSEVQALKNFIRSMELKLLGMDGANTCQLRPEDIYYFETVDGKVFAYLEAKVWQIAKSLETLESELGNSWDAGFFRISKSCIVNLKHVKQLTSTMGNRILMRMENGEEVMVSRHYAKMLRAYLKAGKEGEDE